MKSKDALAAFFASLPSGHSATSQVQCFKRNIAELQGGDVDAQTLAAMKAYVKAVENVEKRGIELRNVLRPHWLKKYYPA